MKTKINHRLLNPISLLDFEFQTKNGYKDTFIVFIYDEEKEPKLNCVTISVSDFNKYLIYKRAESRIPTVVLKPE